MPRNQDFSLNQVVTFGSPTIMEGDAELISLFDAATSGGEDTLPLLKLSTCLADDTFVAACCAHRAGYDRFGNVQVTRAIMEELVERFGGTTDELLSGLRSICQKPWFVPDDVRKALPHGGREARAWL